MSQLMKKNSFLDEVMMDIANDKVHRGNHMTPPRPIKGSEHLSYSFIIKGFDDVESKNFSVYLIVHGGPVDLVSGFFYIVQQIMTLNDSDIKTPLNVYRRLHIYTGPKKDPYKPDLRIVASITFTGFERQRTNVLAPQPLSIWKSNEKLTINDIIEAAGHKTPQVTLIIENKPLQVSRDLLSMISPIFAAAVNTKTIQEHELVILGFDYATVENAMDICKGMPFTFRDHEEAQKVLKFARYYCIYALVNKIIDVIVDSE